MGKTSNSFCQRCELTLLPAMDGPTGEVVGLMWEGVALGTGIYLCIMDKDQRAQVSLSPALQGFTSMPWVLLWVILQGELFTSL